MDTHIQPTNIARRRDKPKPKAFGKLRCSNPECGKTIEAACGCGMAYVPASVIARAAIKANLTLSDRAIGEMIGVDHKTVARERELVGEDSPTRRTGKDGKSYQAKKKKSAKKEEPTALMLLVNEYHAWRLQMLKSLIGHELELQFQDQDQQMLALLEAL
jgi:hypothetical protein